jgi:hypothetical protein
VKEKRIYIGGGWGFIGEGQAGLKLVKQNAQVETFLIDHIENLSAN